MVKPINFKYYTKTGLIGSLFEIIELHLPIKSDDLIIEPSAGNGSFINSIKKLNCSNIFYDIAPEHPEIIKQDFLKVKVQALLNVHVMGNPPFGRQSSLAIKFIKKSCEFASSISFILPKSFKKETMKRHFESHFHCIHESDIPDNSFYFNEKEYNIPCVFQIWNKSDKQREVIEKLEPIGFKFVKKNENPNISFRRVGVNAGTVSTEIHNKSDQSHYFIKSLENMDYFKFDFEFNNTVGPRSISKQELLLKIKERLS